MDQIDTRMTWRRWAILLVFLGLTIWVFSRFTDIKALIDILSQGIWEWVLLAVVLNVVYFWMDAQLYAYCFTVVGVKGNAWELLPVLFGAYSLNIVIPSGGAAGGALFVADAVRRGQPGARATVGTALVLLADLSTLIPWVVFSVLYLYWQGKLFWYDMISSVIFVLFILFLSGALLLAHWKRNWLRRLLKWISTAVNHVGSWFRHPGLLSKSWPEDNAEQLAAGAKAIVTHPRELARALGWAVLMHIVNMVGLYALFLAFRQPVRLGTLTAGFSLGIVFWVVTVIPQGVAAVEGIMGLVFTSLGIPSNKAAAIVLAFRGVNFYLPLVFGFVLLRYVIRRRRRESSSDQDKDKAG